MISGIDHIAINCSNEENSIRFYCILGFSLKNRVARPEKNDIIIWLEGHGIVIELFIRSNCPQRLSYPEAYGLRHLALKVSNLEEELKMLQSIGVISEDIRFDETNNKKMTFIKDPDGLPIELHE